MPIVPVRLQRANILLVEDSASQGAVYEGYLRKRGARVRQVLTAGDAVKALDTEVPDAVLLDLRLPDRDGRTVLAHVREQGMPCAVIIVTAHGSVDVAVELMQLGADDFLEKPFAADRLLVTLDNALQKRQLEHLVDSYREDFGRDRFHGFIGSSLPMQAVYRIIRSAATSKATVFVTGESGTGKELSAEAIHAESDRHAGPFVALNCAAIPRDLMESEIFGHVKGAFTGALQARVGAASQADGGTLFLDEIGELSLELQSKLLRFVQTGTFKQVGGSRTEQVDVRFVCATNRDPLEEVRAGRFREDLYYRLHVIPIHLPPLREREDDVLPIGEHLLHRFAAEEGKAFRRFSPAAAQRLQQYHWPGNVRELQNVIRNVVVLHQGEEVSAEMLPPPLDRAVTEAATASAPQLGPARNHDTVSAADEVLPLWQVEKEAIEQAVARCGGNVPQAAALLQISPSTIYRKRQSWQAQEEGA